MKGRPRRVFSTVPTAAFKNGDFSNLVDASGNLIRIYDPATGHDVNGVWTRDAFPGNRIPADRINPTARAMMAYYPDANNSDPSVAPWQRNLAWAEHFNKDVFWNWVGKVDHNFSGNDRTFFRWAENERHEIGNLSNAIRTGPAADGQLPLIRSNRAVVGDWVHIFGTGTVFNLRGGYTYFLEWSQNTDAFNFNATEFWPASLVNQLPSAPLGGLFPRIELDQYASLSRGTSPNRNRNWSLQPNVSLNRGAHNIRSGLDIRWINVHNENYNNAGGAGAVQPQLHPQHAEQHQRARRQRLRLVPARRPERRRRRREPGGALQVVLRGAVDPGRLEGQQQMDVEPRLSVGRATAP